MSHGDAIGHRTQPVHAEAAGLLQGTAQSGAARPPERFHSCRHPQAGPLPGTAHWCSLMLPERSHLLTGLCLYRKLAAARGITGQSYQLITKGRQNASAIARKLRIPTHLHLTMGAGNKTLSECFVLFDVIHRCMVSVVAERADACKPLIRMYISGRVTTEHATVAALTKQVLASFAADGVVYVELRTTPKVRPGTACTRGLWLSLPASVRACCRRAQSMA